MHFAGQNLADTTLSSNQVQRVIPILNTLWLTNDAQPIISSLVP